MFKDKFPIVGMKEESTHDGKLLRLLVPDYALVDIKKKDLYKDIKSNYQDYKVKGYLLKAVDRLGCYELNIKLKFIGINNKAYRDNINMIKK